MEKNTILTFINIFILFFQSSIYCQEPQPSSLMPTTPASPTAKELGKYGAMPVSYYTGTPQIGIPLYEFKCGTYTLPISLSYHASGIKINDIASWVGLGWSLSAGGGITVCPKGKFDFSLNRFDIRSKDELIALDLPNDNELYQVHLRNKDSEPDVYNYNFCGFSGQFVLDEEFVVHFLKNNDGIKVVCERTHFPNPCGDDDCGHWEAKFIVTDKNGRKYHFEDFEITKRDDYALDYEVALNIIPNGNPYPVGSNYSSANDEIEFTNWMLTKIELENRIDQIDFYYHTEESKFQTGYSGTLMACENNNCLNSSQDFEWRSDQMVFRFSKIENTVQVLDSITFSRDGSKIVFKSNHLREDIIGTHALTEIEVWSPTGRILVWEFDYSEYFISEFSIGNDVYGNPLRKRLKLNKLTQLSGDKTKSFPPFEFKYFGDDEGEYKLPPRNSFDGFDHWGYSNEVIIQQDALNPGRLFPKLQDENPPEMYFICVHNAPSPGYNDISTFTWVSPSVPDFLNGGNRIPDGNFAKSNTIKEIIYPTGGNTKFDYEGNEYSIVFSQGSYDQQECGGLRIKKIEDSYDGINNITRTFSYGSGVLFGKPVYLQPVFKKGSDGMTTFMTCGAGLPSAMVGGYNLYSFSIESLYMSGADNIGYTSVTESTGNGSIKYEYYSGFEYILSYNYYYAYKQSGGYSLNSYCASIGGQDKPIYPFSLDFLSGEFSGDSYKRGSIKNIYFKDIDGNTVKKEQYEYDAIEREKVIGNRVVKIDYTYYFIDAYEVSTGKNFLTSKTITEYDFANSSSIENIFTYTYNNNVEQLKTIETTNSNGDIQKLTYIYPHDIYGGFSYNYYDLETSGLVQLKSNYRIAEPIEKTTEINSLMINASLLSYQTFDPDDPGSPAVPYRQYLIESNVSFAKEDTEVIPNGGTGLYEFTIDPQYKVKGEYVCDQFGNVVTYLKTGDLPISIYYGYTNTLPVIEAKDATTITLSSALSNLISGDFDSLLEDIGDLKSESQKNEWRNFNIELRAYNTLVNSMINTYTYIPLIGMTSETDPSGKTTYYEYDEFGRLETIRDQDGNVIEHIDYHYTEE